MAYDGAFTPRGPTVLIGTVPTQVVSGDNVAPTAYRIRNLSAAAAYLGWATPLPLNATPTIGTVSAPVLGTPSPNILGLGPGAVEVLYLGANAWFKASAATTFEVTPGEGL